jgi:tetratricopeptide (TPR) repeat protein
LLGVIVLAIYGRCLTWSQPNQGFALDNEFILLEDARLRKANWENIWLIFTKDYWWPKAVSGLYRPVTTLSYLFNYSVLGGEGRAAGYLAVNLALHWANAALVYFLALMLLRKGWPAFLSAAVFAAHPVATESVANIVGRADLLATASAVGGLMLYVKSTLVSPERRLPWLGALVLTTVIGVLCKESAVIVLGAMVLYDFTYRMRPLHANWLLSAARNFWRFALNGYFALLVPLLLLWLLRSWVYARLRPAEFPFADNPLVDAGGFAWRLTAIKVIGKYFGLLLWPATLSCDYSYNQIPIVRWPFRSWEDWQAPLALAAIAALLVAAVYQCRRNRAIFFFVFFFFLALLPASNLVFRTGSIMAERFLYTPSIGFAGCLVAVLCRTRCRALARLVIIAAVIALGARAAVRSSDWERNSKLWSKAVRACPNSFKTHKSFGFSKYQRYREASDRNARDLDQAIAEAEKGLAILLNPPLRDDQVPAVVPYQLGVYYRLKGDSLAVKLSENAHIATPLAIPWYEKSVETLRLAVKFDHAYNTKNRQTEIARGRKPAEIADEGMTEIYAQLGESHMRLSQYTNAVSAWRYWRHLDPGALASYINLASAYVKLNEIDAAAVTYLQAILLDPSCQPAWSTLIQIYRLTDPQDCAIRVVNGQQKLNADCPIVSRQLCAAYHGLVETFLQAKQFEPAKNFRNNAVSEARCPPEPLDQLLSQARVSERSSQ